MNSSEVTSILNYYDSTLLGMALQRKMISFGLMSTCGAWGNLTLLTTTTHDLECAADSHCFARLGIRFFPATGTEDFQSGKCQ